ncbi:MAG: hypothetical protein M3Y48_20400 [Actinomycetota bacterium]|nr:hypothetical protein [Actinomycetota bacterium]
MGVVVMGVVVMGVVVIGVVAVGVAVFTGRTVVVWFGDDSVHVVGIVVRGTGVWVRVGVGAAHRVWVPG